MAKITDKLATPIAGRKPRQMDRGDLQHELRMAAAELQGSLVAVATGQGIDQRRRPPSGALRPLGARA